MLLYVNKKKEKRRKIKKIITVSICFLLILGNLLHFKTALHTPSKSLTNYHSIKLSQNWYENAEITYLFTNPSEPQKIIVIPKHFNRENTLTTALALSKLSPNNTTTLSFTPEITKKKELQKLVEIFLPQVKISENNAADLLITSDIKNVEPLIRQKKLYPDTLNYKHAQKLQNSPSLTALLDTYFPLPPKPADTQEKEQLSLQTFAQNYHIELQNLLSTKKISNFSAQNLFLQNAKICIKTKDKTTCRTSPEISLKKNLIKALAGLPEKQKPQKLIFLTSEQKIPEFTSLAENEGLLFRCQNREALLLPESISALTNKTNAYYILKKQAGLNPQYTSPDMTFYKFKTMEININDSI